MPSAVDGLAEVRDRLRRRGFRVTEVDGWQTRGKGTLRPRGFVWHHTAAPGTGRTRSLRLVTYGRPGLENNLCNWYVAVDGELFLVGAEVAWHAGQGGWRGLSGNSSVLGCEWESDGTSQRATPEAYAAMLALAQECGAVFGYGPEMNCEHKEWTSRKIDRYGFSGPAWREAIAIGNPPAPAPPPPPIEEDDEMHISLAPGEEDMYWIEPTVPGQSAIGVKKVLVVLTTHGSNQVPVHAYLQSEGGPGPITVVGSQPWEKWLVNRPAGWLHIQNKGTAHVGGRILEVR